MDVNQANAIKESEEQNFIVLASLSPTSHTLESMVLNAKDAISSIYRYVAIE